MCCVFIALHLCVMIPISCPTPVPCFAFSFLPCVSFSIGSLFGTHILFALHGSLVVF
jgi:hypothetical protein